MKPNTFDKWLTTESGQRCLERSIVVPNMEEYLKNRLFHAFSAGMLAVEPCELQKTIDWYEQEKRESDRIIRELQSKVARLKKSQPQPLKPQPLSKDDSLS
jgi:hypothetical protein